MRGEVYLPHKVVNFLKVIACGKLFMNLNTSPSTECLIVSYIYLYFVFKFFSFIYVVFGKPFKKVYPLLIVAM